MQYRIQQTCDGIDWQAVYQLLQAVDMANRPVELMQKAFENSYCTVFIFEGESIVGCGRAISDGVYQAGLYNIAVLPYYQGKNIGKLIVDALHQQLQGMNVILYARPGKELFYHKLGYRRLLTGMARFVNEGRMRDGGYIE